jgi:4'-phosphopantetheinyl transferase
VWRIAIGPAVDPGPYWSVLSPQETARATRLRRDRDRDAFVIARGALRRILAAYAGSSPEQLSFAEGTFGKPALSPRNAGQLEFNVSHSGDLALLAVSRERAVGIDVARHDAAIDHPSVARFSFSSSECEVLRSLSGDRPRFVEAFYAVWTRKEAYLKAQGFGLARGTVHFDVSCAPGESPELIADRLDPGAPSEWAMIAFDAGRGYSAALVVARPVGFVRFFDAPAPPIDATFHAPQAST